MRDVRVVHHREGLSFTLESRHHLIRVHSELDELQRDVSPHRAFLLGEVHDPHATASERADDAVRSDPIGVLETHLSRNFTRKFWGSLDLRVVVGLDDIGESYAQELAAKAANVRAVSPTVWTLERPAMAAA